PARELEGNELETEEETRGD
ncbi:hypothetical protein CCACVL1_19550, partial [Corchorus capsularis]